MITPHKRKAVKQARLKLASLCLLGLVLCGCVSHTSVRKDLKAGKSYEPVKPASLSEYIRAVYKVEHENNNKQAEERAALLAQSPELADLSSRVDRNPADRDAAGRLAAAYIDHQLFWSAYELLTSAQAASPDDVAINLNLARVWDGWGEYDLALSYGERAIGTGAASAQAYEVLGRIHLHRSDPAQAIASFTEAAQRENKPSILSNLGYSYILAGDWETARTTLEKAVELDDAMAEAHNNLAIVLTKLGDEEGALQQLSKTGKPPVAMNNMGVLYLQENKLDRARYFFEEAVRLEPTYEIALQNLRAVELQMHPAASEGSTK